MSEELGTKNKVTRCGCGNFKPVDKPCLLCAGVSRTSRDIRDR